MITAKPRIETLEDLCDHLQYAIGLELTTIPAYLCALYSISPGANSAAYETIQSVVLEEMLHMALAANVLNAIGGVPSTGPVAGGPSPVPVYPALVPFIDRIPVIHLQAFSPTALDEFIAIESPTEQHSSTSGKRSTRQDSSDSGEQFGSIGDFYRAIEDGVRRLCPPKVFADARHKRGDCQVRSAGYYGGAGTLIEVKNQKSALQALTAITREGEGLARKALRQTARAQKRSGMRPGRLAGHRSLPVVDADELPYGWKLYSHYARFKEIRYGRRYRPEQLVGEKPAGDILPTDWRAVRLMTVDPTAQKYCGTWAYEPMIACNKTYTALVDTTYRAFNGESNGLCDAVRLMYELKYQAHALFNTPSPLPFESGRTLGPAFEYLHDQDDRSR
jgi:Ferritin-like